MVLLLAFVSSNYPMEQEQDIQEVNEFPDTYYDPYYFDYVSNHFDEEDYSKIPEPISSLINKQTFKCSKCIKYFDTKSDFEEHLSKKHNLDINSYCSECDTSFASKAGKDQHIKRTHNPKFQSPLPQETSPGTKKRASSSRSERAAKRLRQSQSDESLPETSFEHSEAADKTVAAQVLSDFEMRDSTTELEDVEIRDISQILVNNDGFEILHEAIENAPLLSAGEIQNLFNYLLQCIDMFDYLDGQHQLKDKVLYEELYKDLKAYSQKFNVKELLLLLEKSFEKKLHIIVSIIAQAIIHQATDMDIQYISQELALKKQYLSELLRWDFLLHAKNERIFTQFYADSFYGSFFTFSIRELENYGHCKKELITSWHSLKCSNQNINSLDGLNQAKYDVEKCTALSLDKNKLSHIKTEDISFLKDLEELNLENNKFTQIPICIFNSRLQKLNLRNNAIKNFNGKIHASNLKTLDLSNNELTECKHFNLPECLTRLSLDDNHISNFDFSQMINLKRLGLRENQLTRISSNWLPKKLKYISVSENQIKQIPELPNTVKSFLATKNNITSIKPSILPSSLQTLALDNNQIALIEKEKFPSTLKSLSLAHNKLKKLPVGILPSTLEHLELHNNPEIHITPGAIPAGKKLCISIDRSALIPEILPRELNILKICNNNNAYLDVNVLPTSLQELHTYGIALSEEIQQQLKKKYPSLYYYHFAIQTF